MRHARRGTRNGRGRLLLAAAVLAVLAAAGRGRSAESPASEMEVSERLVSLYGERNLMTIPKASRKHDRVTIRIDESTTAKHEATTDLTRESTREWNVDSWFTLRFEDGELVAVPRTGNKKPTLDLSSTREHNGEGETERASNFKSEISGEVVDVLPNGHLVIEAHSATTVNEEEQTLVLMGRIDPRDLDATNVIDAKYIIDKRIRFTGKGAISRMNKRGWGARILDVLSPF